MKILTLNTHSLVESEYEKKLIALAKMILKEQPDIISMQEVNQTESEQVYPSVFLDGYTRCKDCNVVIRQDNHAARLAHMLNENGLKYYWTWIPIKLGYDKYDEGLAIFSREPILESHQFPSSRIQDYYNWKSRKVLGIRTAHVENSWFYCVHMGWWNDAEEPFSEQWDEIERVLKSKSGQIWIMGDFNSPAGISGEGYDYVRQHGWKDSYIYALTKDCGNTVEKVIDGWNADEVDAKGMRIDMIWSKQQEIIKSSRVVFDGKEYPVISDHYGVMIEVEGEQKHE